MNTAKDSFRPLGSRHIEGGRIFPPFGEFSTEEMDAAIDGIYADKKLANWHEMTGASNLNVAAVAYMRRKYGAAQSATSETR